MLINNLSLCLKGQKSIGDGHLRILLFNSLHTTVSVFRSSVSQEFHTFYVTR